MNTGLFMLLAMGLAMLIRLIPSWRWPVVGPDAGQHLFLRREIRRHGFRAPAKLVVCRFNNRMTYPWLYHQFIAALPESWLRRLPALPSALIDALHTALVFLAGSWLARQVSSEWDPARTGLACALLFCLNPALMASGIGPRAYEITPRPFGELLFTISLWTGLQAVHFASWTLAAVAVLAGAGVFLSSKFAVQVMFIFVAALSLCPGLHLLWLLLLGSLSVALLLSGGRYCHVIRGHINHLAYYMRQLQYTLGATADLNRWSQARRLGGVIRERGLFSRETRTAAADLYFSNTYLQMAARGIIFLLLAVALSLSPSPVPVDLLRFRGWLVGWAFVWIFPFLLTSWKHARFLGEAERYAEYSVAPAALLAGLEMSQGLHSRLLAVLLALFFLAIIANIIHAARVAAGENRRYRKARCELVDFLQELPAGCMLMGIPWELALAPVASLLPHCFADILSDNRTWLGMVESHFDGYPWPKPDWNLWREAGVQYLVTLRPADIETQRPSIKYDFSPLERLFSNDAYDVYRL